MRIKHVSGLLKLGWCWEGIKPSELCAAVASPGGTTEAGLKVMQAGGIEALAEKAMSAAVNRAKELAEGG